MARKKTLMLRENFQQSIRLIETLTPAERYSLGLLCLSACGGGRMTEHARLHMAGAYLASESSGFKEIAFQEVEK
jgi:hypothetical protein